MARARYTLAGKTVGVAEFSYHPQRWPGPRRFIAIRRPIPEAPSWQLSLFQMGRFLYQVLVTDLDLTPLHVWRFYNDRAEVELVIRELKDAYALGKIPSRQRAVNETYFQLVVFAYNLLNWFRRLCLPPVAIMVTPDLAQPVALRARRIGAPLGHPDPQAPSQLPPSTGVLGYFQTDRSAVALGSCFTPDSG